MPNVKLLLNESIKHVGKVGDVVDVSAGYARNFLLPKGLAVQPTPNNIKKIEIRRKEIEKQEQDRLALLAKVIKQLEGVEVALERKANEQGHLFGSVSATDISKALKSLGHTVNADDIYLPGKLDRIEKYTVSVRFSEELKTELKIWVAPDKESKELMDDAAKRKAEEPAPASNFETSKR